MCVSARAELEAGDIRHGRARTDIHDNLVTGEQAGAASVQGDLDGLRAHEASAAHDEFDAALLVGIQVECDVAINHILLAATNLDHIGLDGVGQCTELRGVLNEVGHPCTPELVLGWETGDRWARAADPAALHHGNLLAGTAKVPCEQFSTLPAAYDDDIEVFSLGHA